MGVAIVALLAGGGYVASQHIDWQQYIPTGEVEHKAEEQEKEDVTPDTPEQPVVPQTQEPVEQEPVAQEPIVQESTAQEDTEAEYIFADSDKKLLTKKQLRECTKKELRLARNEIYARYGVIFDDEQLDNYFKDKSWYAPKMTLEEFYEKKELNDIEEENVALIGKIEKEK